ncbi:MAG: 3-oxo-tetronate kinase [Alkalilacustris sp.]
MYLGCIGDDFTGSSDLGNTLTRAGMACVQYVGVPDAPANDGVEAGIVALKSRSVPAADAVAQSLAALDWLRAQGAQQVLFKICSTFDSTDAGNIGPVAEALADALGAEVVPVCPAFPATGRTVYQGHLFVGDRLLSESGMEAHPLTPMTDPDIRRVLARQSRGDVGHIPLAALHADARAALAAPGPRLRVVDAVGDGDLVTLGRAAADLPLLVGGSGIALGLPANFAARGGLRGGAADWRGQGGPAVALSGSCSRATLAQVAHHAARHPARAIAPEDALTGAADPDALADWAMEAARGGALPLIHSSAAPEAVAAAQARFGTHALADAIEGLFAALARALVARGVSRLITAGGETSGTVVTGLGLTALRIGPEIDPGVPMIRAGGLLLALKSGNFGAEDFFAKAAARMEDDQ